MAENAFDLPGQTPGDEDIEAAFSDDEATPEAAEQTPAEATDVAAPEPEAAGQEAPEATDVAEQPPEGEQPEGEQPEGEETAAEQLLAGKYRTQEDLEQAHLHLQSVYGRQSQQFGQAVELLRRWAPAIQQMQQQRAQPQPVAGQTPEGELDPEIAQTIEPLVQRRVAEAMQQVQAQTTQQIQQAQEQQALAEATAAVDGFFKDHPDVAQGSLEDQRVSAFLDEFNYYPDRDTLELALEAVRNPVMYQMFRETPALIDTDAGVALVRRVAGGAGGKQPTSTPSPAGPTPSTGQRVDSRSRVEGGANPPPAEDQGTPEDPWEQVLQLHRTEEKKSPILGV